MEKRSSKVIANTSSFEQERANDVTAIIQTFIAVILFIAALFGGFSGLNFSSLFSFPY